MENKDLTKGFNIDDYLFVNPSKIKEALLNWLAERQAQKRYSKPVDLFVLNEKGFFNINATEKLLNLSKELNLDDEIFYKTEKHLSYNNGDIENAEVFWILDYDEYKPLVTMIKSQDVRYKTIYAGKVIEIGIQKQIIEYKDTEYIIIEERNKDHIYNYLTTDTKNFTPLTNEELSSLPKEVMESIEYDLEEKEWTVDFEPFVHLKNNPDALSDKAYIENDLEDLVVLTQKKRDDINFSSVKVVTGGTSSKDKNKEGNANNKAALAHKRMAASSIVIRQGGGLGDAADSSIVNSIPNTAIYDNAQRTVINNILKKTGGATDVDSKGTVQQSKGEILQSQGDEYKVSKWKGQNRQEKIRELFIKLWKIYTSILKQTNNFKNAKSLFVIISQEEVLSEADMLANLKEATLQGLTNKLISFARYNGLNVVDAYYMMNMQTDGVNEKS